MLSRNTTPTECCCGAPVFPLPSEKWRQKMISAGDFRNGVTFEMDGNVYQIIEFQHVKPGKGAAFVRTKIRNVIAGSVVEKGTVVYVEFRHLDVE